MCPLSIDRLDINKRKVKSKAVKSRSRGDVIKYKLLYGIISYITNKY